MRWRATDLLSLLHEIGTETDITEQQKHPGSTSETGGNAHGFPWRKFAGFSLVLVLLLCGGAIVWFVEDGIDSFPAKP